MDEVDSWILGGINFGVYKCGLSKTQEAYDAAIVDFNNAMERLEAHLADKKFLTGDRFTMSDVRLFVTLIRHDEAYICCYKLDSRKVSEYPNMMRYLKDCWRVVPGCKETTKMDHIKGHYFTSYPDLNKFGIIPTGPKFLKLLETE